SVRKAANFGRPIFVEDALHDGRVQKDMVSDENVHAFMQMPVHLGQQVYGVLNVCFAHPRSFDNDDERLMRALATRAASALENARLYQQIEAAATAEERQRLARELHDAVTQTLFSASLIAEVLPHIWERAPEQGRQRLEELRELTRGALAEMRTLLLELRPAALLEARLGDLLEQLGEAITGRARVPISVTIEGEDECVLSPDIKVAIYRVAQESLNNIAKHAGATQASISLRCGPDHVHLIISDDGRGFDLGAIPPNHLGLTIMRERAQAIGALLQIDTAIGRGTRVELIWEAAGASHAAPPPADNGAR
ncbi:MAG: GAF domain-containing sensor histidine kinase, partial [Anaerolineae bacterium]|nr:GAF domain-containing sensor histidine kinase [Anaerolineae bacterium]